MVGNETVSFSGTLPTPDGEKHYRKYLAMGRYLTLLGEISLKREA